MLEKFDHGKSKQAYDIVTGDVSWIYYASPYVAIFNNVFSFKFNTSLFNI